VTLRVGDLADGPASLDDEGTWLLGHTDRISFGRLWQDGDDLYAEATLHVPCRHFAVGGASAACRAHGFTGPTPAAPAPDRRPRRLGEDRFEVLDGLALRTLELPVGSRPGLPVVDGPNPCATAPCRTADHVRGAACCRDLQVEIVCPETNTALESLVRARRSPYLCKVDRESPTALGVEMISACSFLDDDGPNCTLHGRTRPDGRPAKPSLCFDWPDGEVYHPGCVFQPAGAQETA
jgi:hypothetical protein